MRKPSIVVRFALILLVMLPMLLLTVAAAVTGYDTQAPAAPKELTASSVTYTGALLIWKASTDNIGIKGYELYCNEIKVASTTKTYYEYNKLSPGSTYSFYVKACDKAGNYSEKSNPVSVSTVPDKTAPSAPGGLKASSVTLSEMNLTWQPAADNVKVRGYDIIRNGIKIGTTTKTCYCSKGLIPGKAYTYTVRAVDTCGNLSADSSPLVISALKDTTAPSPPTELKITAIKGNSVSLAWTASTDNGKVAGYQIYCNGLVISTSSGTSRTLKSPFGLGSDIYWIKAYDQSGNLSGSSNTVTAITAVE